MTLQVPFESFAASARELASQHVYLANHLGFALATSADPARGIVVAAISRLSLDTARTTLHGEGLQVTDGAWSTQGLTLPDESHDCYIAAVSYVSGEDRPGVWVDAYSTLPTQVQVLMELHEELLKTGQLREVNFETFVELARPNVVIVTPREVEGYLAQKGPALITE